MARITKLISLLVKTIVGTTLLLSVGESQTTVEVSPATRNVQPESTFTVDIRVNNVTELHSGSIQLSFDNTIIRSTVVAQGPFLLSGGESAFFTKNPAPGPSVSAITVDQAILGAQPGYVSGSGVVISITFVAIQNGTSPITLSLVDLRGGLIFTNLIPASVTNGLITVGTALPIQIASFTGHVVNGSNVRLDWTTLSEVNNYGFEVQKSASAVTNFQTIGNSFILGNGTTNVPHHYSFTELNPANGSWFYRLMQQDLDGTVHFTEPIHVDVLTDVSAESTPKTFAFPQNYPNPFNPSTTFSFEIPQKSSVILEVYNLLGENLETLVSQELAAGRHTVEWNPNNASSGTYLARLTTGGIVQTRKLLLLR